MVEDLFLHFVERNAQAARRESFRLLKDANPLPYFTLHPWPVWLETDEVRRLEERNVTVAKLVRGVPQRVYGGDLARLRRYFGVHDEPAMALALAEPDGGDAAIFRGDFIETDRGPMCIEMNGGNAGGWLVAALAPLYARVPVLGEFLASHGLTLSAPDGLRLLFGQLVRAARRLDPPATASPLDLAVTIVRERPGEFNAAALAMCRHAYRSALLDVAPGAVGDAAFCEWHELHVARGEAHRGSQRLAILVAEEPGAGEIARQIVHAFKARRLVLARPPAVRLWNDKRSLAALSEHADSPLFDEPERRSIAACIPWTRRVLDGPARFGGVEASLVDLLANRRASLVLKRAISDGGRHVFLGPFTAPPEWDQAVRNALEDGDWVVQEWLPPRPRTLLSEAGPATHHAVLGAFVVGECAMGGLIRVLSADGYTARAHDDGSLRGHVVRATLNSDLSVEVVPLMAAVAAPTGGNDGRVIGWT